MSALHDLPIPPEVLGDEPFAVERIDDDHDLEEVARWRIGGDREAAWAMSHLAKATAERAALAEQAADWRARIDAWFDQASRTLTGRINFFAGHLEHYALERRAESEDRIKTLVLPDGEVKTTGRSPKVVVLDEDAVTDWAVDACESIVEVTQRVSLSGLRANVTVVELPYMVIVSPCGHEQRPFDNGHILEFTSHDEVARWSVGTAVVCTECAEDALVAQWSQTVLAVRDRDGRAVPGCSVDLGGVTAKAVPHG